MAKETNSYDYIAEKIHSMKETYSTLRSKPDYYVFSALFIKVAFYKNPELPLNENDFNNMIFDGSNDCGIDILLFDPTSDEKELIIGQAKFCKTITSDEVLNALRKMADGYKDLKEGHYERANERLNSRFIELDDKVDEESRIRFVFYTSAPKLTNRTIERIKTKFLEEFLDTDAIEVKILFDTDIKKEIDDAASWKSIVESGKLCMAAIFQMPCVSRNKKKMIYQDRYYKYIFIEKQPQVAKICKELLYINHYFNETFKPKFKRDNENEDDAELRLPLANKARTICIAFTALAARYHQGNITDQELRTIFAAATSQSNSTADDLYKAVRDIGSMQSLFPKKFSENMNLYDAALDKLFTAIIEEGILIYSFVRDSKPTLTANSFLQDDKNYYLILKRRWSTLKAVIRDVFSEQ